MNHRDLIRQLLLTSVKSITDATDIKDLQRLIVHPGIYQNVGGVSLIKF